MKKDILLEQLFKDYDDALKESDRAWDALTENENEDTQEAYSRELKGRWILKRMFIHFGYAKEFCNKYPDKMSWIIEEVWMDIANEEHELGNRKATMLEILREFHYGKK